MSQGRFVIVVVEGQPAPQWEIDITKADGTMVEVLVDAGNAGNLAQETD